MPNQINRDIYVKKNKIKEPIDYVKNTNAIPIVFNFRDYEIPSGATAQVFVQKPSKKSVYDDAAISGNSVSVDVKTQMMAEVGFANMQIQITQGDENLVTFDQPIRVYENRTDPDAPQSENESSFFGQLQGAADSANQAAQNANDAAQDIQQRAEEGEFSSTISIGNTTTGAPGTQAQVTNTGTDKDPIFNFTIPQGPQGPQGPAGNIDDLEDATVTFNQANTRTNINSGDSVATLFGKIKKWFSDLGTAAFQGVSNVLTQTSSGYVLDARQGKTLADRIGTLSSLLTAAKTSLVSAVNELFNKIGDLDDLNTTEKDDIVGAINETNASLSDLSSSKVSGFGDMETVSNPYTPDVDGFIRIYFSPSGSTNATVYATQNGISHFSATSSGGANIAQFFPALAGHTYQGQASQPGTIQLAFMPLRTG